MMHEAKPGGGGYVDLTGARNLPAECRPPAEGWTDPAVHRATCYKDRGNPDAAPSAPPKQARAAP